MTGCDLPLVVVHLRAATGDIHRRIEEQADIVLRLADPLQRPDMVRRYAALFIPAGEALNPFLADLAGLDLPRHKEAPVLAQQSQGTPLPAFPSPRSRAEALGMSYVLEGSMLGGRLILRMLADRGIHAPELTFLDPYGAQTGARWRGFLSVLSREIGGDAVLIEQACRGARSAFQHAERVLCGSGT